MGIRTNFRKLYQRVVPLEIRKRLTGIKSEFLRKKGLKQWLAYVSDRRLYSAQTEDERHEVFKKFVSVVHLEISNFCNRQCVYCPNSRIASRHEKKQFLAEEYFLKCINELKQINYCEFVEFNGFNEPLENRKIFLERASQLKATLPESKLVINSNGDFLSPEYLNAIAAVGVDMLLITLHLNSLELNISSEERCGKAGKFFNRFPEIEFKNCPEINMYKAHVGSMLIFLRVANFIDEGHNFGGSVKNVVKRELPCFVPVKHVYVDYSGRVCLCCSTNLDIPELANFVIGQISEASLYDLYSSTKAQALREGLVMMTGDIPVCCRLCDAQESYVCNRENIYNPYSGLWK